MLGWEGGIGVGSLGSCWGRCGVVEFGISVYFNVIILFFIS